MGEIPKYSSEMSSQEKPSSYERWVDLTSLLHRLQTAAKSGDLEAQASLDLVGDEMRQSVNNLAEAQAREIDG